MTRQKLDMPAWLLRTSAASVLLAWTGCVAPAADEQVETDGDSHETYGTPLPKIIGHRTADSSVWFELSAPLDARSLRLSLTELTTRRDTNDGGQRPVNIAADSVLEDDGYTLGIRLAVAPRAGESYVVRIATEDADGLHYIDFAPLRAVDGVAQEGEFSVDALSVDSTVPKHAVVGGQTHLETIGMRTRTMQYPLEAGNAYIPREPGRLALTFRSAQDQPALVPCVNGVPTQPVTLTFTPKVLFASKYTLRAERLGISCSQPNGNSEFLWVDLPGALVGGVDYDMRLVAHTTHGDVDENVKLISENPALSAKVLKVESWLDKNCDDALIAKNRRCDLYLPVAGSWRECTGEGGKCGPGTANWVSAAAPEGLKFPTSGDWEDISVGSSKTINGGVVFTSQGPVSDVVSLYVTAVDHDRSDRAATATKISAAVAEGVGSVAGLAWAPAEAIGAAVGAILNTISEALAGNSDDTLATRPITLTRYAWEGGRRWGLDLTGPRNVNGQLEWQWFQVQTPKGDVWLQMSISEMPASFVP